LVRSTIVAFSLALVAMAGCAAEAGVSAF
jgi:hypothetical protein